MITQTVTVTEKDTQNIIIGRRGTYNTEQIAFDVSYLIEKYGNGTAALLIRRPKDTDAYPKTVERDGNLVLWTVDDTDTSVKGHGECELFWYVGDGLTKTVNWDITILRDIGESSETPPDPYVGYVQTVVDAAQSAEASAQRAEQAAQSIGHMYVNDQGYLVFNPQGGTSE